MNNSNLSTLYVGDLTAEVTERDLHAKFDAIGPVAGIHVCRDSLSRRSLGYAYVNYFTLADAQQALEKLNYAEIKGKCCRIMWSKREKPYKASPEANIFVKNLDPTIDSRSLNDTFSMFGAILSCKVATSPDGSSRGYGFVQYESEDAAKQAIERVNGMLIGGKKVFVGPFQKRDFKQERLDDENSLYVRNIPEDYDEAAVLKLFEPFGKITSNLLMSDTRAQKQHGFINFEDAEHAKAAIEALNGKDMRTEEEKAKETEEAADETKPKEDGDDKEGADGKPGKDKLPSYCLLVGKAKSKSERDAEAKERQGKRQDRFEGIKLHVKNLPETLTDEELKGLFEPFGTVTDVKVVQDKETQKGKGYGFVRFQTMEQATDAVEKMNLKEAFPDAPALQVSLAGNGEDGKGKSKGKGDKGEGKGKGKGSFGKGKSAGKGFSGFPPMQGSYPPQQMGPPMYGAPSPLGMGMPPMFPMMGAPRPGMPGGMPPFAMMRPPMPAMMRPPMMAPQGMVAAGSLPPQAPPGAAPVMSAAAPPSPAQQKQQLGERLFPMVSRLQPAMAGKITGMLLEMSNEELIAAMQSEEKLKGKVDEAMAVLEKK